MLLSLHTRKTQPRVQHITFLKGAVFYHLNANVGHRFTLFSSSRLCLNIPVPISPYDPCTSLVIALFLFVCVPFLDSSQLIFSSTVQTPLFVYKTSSPASFCVCYVMSSWWEESPTSHRKISNLVIVQSNHKTDLDVRNWIVGMRQQIKHSYYTSKSIQNPNNDNHCTWYVSNQTYTKTYPLSEKS